MNTGIRFTGLFLIVMGFTFPSMPPEVWAGSDRASAQVLIIIPERHPQTVTGATEAGPRAIEPVATIPPPPTVQITTTPIRSHGHVTILKTRTEAL